MNEGERIAEFRSRFGDDGLPPVTPADPGWRRLMHRRRTQACLAVPGPPNLGLSLQALHRPQSVAMQPEHSPQRPRRLPGRVRAKRGWPSMRRLVRDEGDWTPPGPGARRGLNRLYGRPRDVGVNATGDSALETSFVCEMRLLLRTLRSLDPEFCKSVDLDLHDVQFQLCEYDKYRRVEDGGHTRPYTPTAHYSYEKD